MQHARIPDRPRSEYQRENASKRHRANTEASFASATPPIPSPPAKPAAVPDSPAQPARNRRPSAPIAVHPALRSQRSAKAIMPTSSRVDKQVSQKIVGIQISGNDTAQNIPARLAVRMPKHCRATCMINSTVITLNRSCIAITAIAAAKVNEPKMRKKRAMTAGYPGARSAVGPVDPPNGELSPCPATSDCASVPSSIPRE